MYPQLVVVLLVHALVALALWPVSDFRVADMPRQRLTGANRALLVGAAMSDSASAPVSTTNTVPPLAPTIQLSSKVQLLLTDDDESIYFVNTTISGTKSDVFPLLLDTGSALSWIYNESCTLNGCNKSSTNKFAAANTDSGLVYDSLFELLYNGDAVSGQMLSLAANDLEWDINALATSNISIGLTSNAPAMFYDYNISGLIGISSTPSTKNLVSQLAASGLLDKEMFALFLISSSQTVKYTDTSNSTVPLPADYGGLIVFGSGAQDYESFTSAIYYTDIVQNDNSYWLINITDIGSATNSTLLKSRQAIIDTGTTGIALPVADANGLHSTLFGTNYITDGNGNYAFPCGSLAKFVFSIDGHQFTVPASAFQGQEYTSAGLQGYCASKVQGLDQSNYWILGAAFLNQYYTIFDLELAKIGFGVLELDTYCLREAQPTSKSSSSSSSSSSTGSSTTLAKSSTATRNNSSTSSSKNTSSRTSFNSLTYIVVCILVCL